MSTEARRPPLFHKAEAESKSFWGELKGFALKGNVVDLAVAVVIGGAFVLFLVIDKLLRARQAPAQPTTKTCPFCMETIPKAATRCRACTSEVVVEV